VEGRKLGIWRSGDGKGNNSPRFFEFGVFPSMRKEPRKSMLYEGFGAE
jgi:hypothetical protein